MRKVLTAILAMLVVCSVAWTGEKVSVTFDPRAEIQEAPPAYLIAPMPDDAHEVVVLIPTKGATCEATKGVQDGPDGVPQGWARFAQVAPVDDPPLVSAWCWNNLADCAAAVARACADHGGGGSARLAWCPWNQPPGSLIECCTGTCVEPGWTVTCQPG